MEILIGTERYLHPSGKNSDSWEVDLKNKYMFRANFICLRAWSYIHTQAPPILAVGQHLCFKETANWWLRK